MIEYTPQKPADLIGAETRALAKSLLGHALKISGKPNASRWKLVLSGPWGNGKTTISNMIAAQLAAGAIDIEKINGRKITIETVRDWQQGAFYGSLFGGWKVKQIEEVDLVPTVAQELMLTYLDDLPMGTAVIASSNKNTETLTERFDTRLAPIQVGVPTSEEIAKFLVKNWKLPPAAANFIAVGCCGNVRDALLRAGTFLITGKVEERARPPANFAAKTRTAVARAEWQNAAA